MKVTVLEGDDMVGGISRTAQYKGFRFDIGGHRFFTKIAPVEALWHEILGDEFISVPRLSRIYYNGKFFDYPLKAGNALRSLGPWNATMIVLSYLKWHYRPYPVEENFEQWVTNRFGKRLYRDLLQDLHGEGLGHSVHRDPGRVGGAADPGAVARAGDPQRGGAQQALDDDQDADQRVPVSASRSRPDVGNVPRSHRRDGQPGAAPAPRRRRSSTSDGRVTAVRAETPDGERRFERRPRHLHHADVRSLVRSLCPAPPPAVARGGRGPELPRLPGRRADAEPRQALSRQLDLHPHAGRQGRADPELQQLERGHGAGAGDDLPRAWSTSASRATACGRAPTRT